MSKKIDIIVADPSGNITIMVLTPVKQQDYSSVAQALLSIDQLNGQQVAFLLPDSPKEPLPQMEMCGLEFCGNASRAFALYKSLGKTPSPKELTVKVSGCDHPLEARIDTETCNVEMQMPIPGSFREFSAKELGLNTGGILVNIDGIAHLILKDVAPMADTFQRIRELIDQEYLPQLPAFGIMFCDTVNRLMTPVVYVKDVDTTYFEGSCASGTVAAAFAIAKDFDDGIHPFTFQQPEGTLSADVTIKDGMVSSIWLKGIVTLSDVITIELP